MSEENKEIVKTNFHQIISDIIEITMQTVHYGWGVKQQSLCDLKYNSKGLFDSKKLFTYNMEYNISCKNFAGVYSEYTCTGKIMMISDKKFEFLADIKLKEKEFGAIRINVVDDLKSIYSVIISNYEEPYRLCFKLIDGKIKKISSKEVPEYEDDSSIPELDKDDSSIPELDKDDKAFVKKRKD